MKSSCFSPIARADAQLLILGSLPGEESLRLGEYYAQKQNAFWKIMERFFGIPHDAPFAEHAEGLMQHKVAVWDVCAAAEREGSLDSNINTSSIIANDFVGFFNVQREIKAVCFNGKKAEDVYRRKVWPNLTPAMQALTYISLPSTSPAHAGMRFEEKCLRWQQAVNQFITTK